MKVFMTSDQHLQNRNIWAKYETSTRPFNSQGEHDAMIIHHWNSVVSPDDLVYVLGDFIMGDAKNVESLLYRLNGKIYLIRGNHDSNNKIEIYKQHPDKVIAIDDYMILYHKEKFVVMNHYPVRGDTVKNNHLRTDSWAKAVDFFADNYDDAVYLYGHVHGNAPHGMVNHQFHVGIDTNNLTPVLLDDIVDML